jgi:tRNA(fMet)-specific endonuclease VapC
MLDTNILIYLIKNKPQSVAQRVGALGDDDELCMSFVTYAELLKGAEGSANKADVLRRLQGLTRQVPVLYRTSASLCEHYAAQSVRLKRTGTPVGSNDLWIACHALAEAAVLVSNNESEFKRVTGLKVENWV